MTQKSMTKAAAVANLGLSCLAIGFAHPPFSTKMSTSYNNSENYAGCDYSLSQLLYAAKRKLQDTVFGGRYVQL